MITNEELDAFGEAEVGRRLTRGDWCDQEELLIVKSWLRRAERERTFLDKCERASVSSALDAKRLAVVGTLISIGALIVAIFALVKG